MVNTRNTAVMLGAAILVALLALLGQNTSAGAEASGPGPDAPRSAITDCPKRTAPVEGGSTHGGCERTYRFIIDGEDQIVLPEGTTPLYREWLEYRGFHPKPGDEIECLYRTALRA